jgi:hypothetical protein
VSDVTDLPMPTTGIPLKDLAKDARALALEAFEARYSRAFFIRHGSWLSTPRVPMQTKPGHGLPGGAEATGDIMIVALPVRRQASSGHPFVGIGRLEGCDIALPDETVSKFHAYVKEHAERTFLLQDARSRNGTTVEGEPVAPRGDGPPTQLKFGQVVRFGSVTTTFIDAAGIVALATRTTRA